MDDILHDTTPAQITRRFILDTTLLISS